MAGLHAVSVPVLLRYLGQLDRMLARLGAFAETERRSEATLLASSLAGGMFDLKHQVLIASGFAIRALLPVAPSLEPLLAEKAVTLEELRAVIARRSAALAALDPAMIDAMAESTARERAGEAVVETDALSFVTLYALPNFFFHLVTAYGIMRQIGIPLGKADFDGFHAYPPGFSFV
ncbi:MAG: DUF1993 family protein [Rhizobiales bacterium]|nr:DUF1993 family protein [Hyphomicrobiales bacterium]